MYLTRTIELSEEGREEEGIEVESKEGCSVRIRLGKEGTSGAGLADTEEREVESTGKEEDSTGKESKEANHKSEEGVTKEDVEESELH